ncbi:MAG: DUF2868 domain-containing protein [Acidobacteriota bacterium]
MPADPAATSAEPTRVALREAEARAVLWTWSLEDADRVGEVLALDRRRLASQAATADVGDDALGAWLVARARHLGAEVTGALGELPRLLRRGDPLAGWTAPVLLGALALGAATNALGPQRQISVLAAPLLLLVAWNVAVILAIAATSALPPVWGGERRPPRLLSLLQRRARRWLERRGSEAALDGGDERLADTRRRAWRLHLDRLASTVAPLETARLRRLLHLASLTTVLGVVLGMYVRGLAFEFRATWESTFLGADTIDAVLGAVLAPAAAVLGREVPAASALRAPIDGPAAPWIHLWAMTAVLFVIVPRGVLALVEHVRAAHLARRLPVELATGYIKRLRAAAVTTENDVQIVAYSHRPTDAAIRRLKSLLLDLLGPRAALRTASPVDYGGELPADWRGSLRLLLFTCAQTPEAEVHGELARAARDELVDGQGLLPVVDEGPLRSRLGAAADDRLDSRRRAWRRVLSEVGLEPAFVDLASDDEAAGVDAVLDALAARVWPPGAGGVVWTG